jgi:CRP/FNR family transcriptional regulator, dissimilatory nitrate respiration regulator
MVAVVSATIIDWVALRADHPVLARMPVALRQAAKLAHLKQGDPVFRVGDSASAVLYLLSGELRLIRRSREGTEIVLQRTRGGFFAEASMDAGRYHCDAVAAEAGDLLRFPARPFREALASDATFRNAWIAHLARELRRLRTQCERLSLNGATERVLHYLESEGSDGMVMLTQTKKAWAAELGLSHEALYRALRRLEEQKVIHVDHNQISLVQSIGTQDRKTKRPA